MTKRLLGLVLGIGIVAGAASPASAIVISYNSRAAFDLAVGPTFSENFDSVAADTSFISPASATVGIMTFSSGPGANSGATNKIDVTPFQFPGIYENGSPYVLGDILTGTSVRVDFSTALTAWGGDLRGIADDGRTAQIEIFDSANASLGIVFLPSASGINNFRFVGFETTAGEVADHIVFTHLAGGNDVWGLDDVAYETSAAVPEPGTLALLGFGLAGLAGKRRKKA